MAGNFLDETLRLTGKSEARFDKILCYSVLHYLADEIEVFAFVARALRLLAPGGSLLLGDLPNESRKRRFLSSPAGKAFARRWEKQKKHLEREDGLALPEDPQLVRFDDALVLQICGECRKQGLDAYILPQPPNLPFGHTREDVLVVKPE